MAEIDHARYPEPDYRKPETDLYTDVVQYLMSTSPYGHMLDILGYAEDYYDYKCSFDLVDLNNLISASAIINEDLAAYWDNPNASTASIESFWSILELVWQVTLNDLQHLESPAYGRFIPKEWLDLFLPLVDLGSKFFSISASDIDENMPFADLPKFVQENRHLLTEFHNLQPVLNGHLSTSEAGDIVSKYLTLLKQHPWFLNVVGRKKSDEDGAGVQGDSIVPVILRHENQIPMDSWPSWVPDWRRPFARTNPLTKEFIKSQDIVQESISREPIYSASRLNPEVFIGHEPSALMSFERGELRILGFRVDKVKKLTPLDLPNNNEKKWPELQKLLTGSGNAQAA